MAMRLAQLGHLRKGPVWSCLMRGLSSVGSQHAPLSPGRSEYRIFLQQGHKNERWLMSVVAATALKRNICRRVPAGGGCQAVQSGA